METNNSLGFKNRDSLDIDYLIIKIEKSFQIDLGKTVLVPNTFGELCDIIINKIELDHSDDCTSQQAYYKVRNAIVTATLIDKNLIAPNTPLETLFLKGKRRATLRIVETELGFKTQLLAGKNWIMFSLIVSFFLSFVVLYFNGTIGLSIIAATIAGFYLLKFGTELTCKTVGEWVEELTRENYVLVRSNNQTVNRKEILQNIKALFAYELSIDVSELNPQTTFA